MKKQVRKADITEAAVYQRIRDLLVAARNTVARGVDLVQVRTNFEIGRHIVGFEQRGDSRAAYGKEIIKLLAEQLSTEFGNGFSTTNLKLMRQFYLLYEARISQTASDLSSSKPIGQTLSDQLALLDNTPFQITQTTTGLSTAPFTLSWSHYVFLLGVKNPDERSFYEIEATNQSWTLRELKRQFDSSLYERLALSRDQEGIRQLARQGQIVSQPKDLLKKSRAGCCKCSGAGNYPMHAVKKLKTSLFVIPAQAGIQQLKNAFCINPLDSRLRGNDGALGDVR